MVADAEVGAVDVSVVGSVAVEGRDVVSIVVDRGVVSFLVVV